MWHSLNLHHIKTALLEKTDQAYLFIRKRVGEGIIRSTRYEVSNNVVESQKILEHKLNNVDFEANPPTEIVPHRAAYFRSFPLLDTVAMNKEPTQRYFLFFKLTSYNLTIFFSNTNVLYFVLDE